MVIWYIWMALGPVDTVVQMDYLAKVAIAPSRHKAVVVAAVAGMAVALAAKIPLMVLVAVARRLCGPIRWMCNDMIILN